MSPAAIADQTTKSKRDKKNMNKRKKQEERSKASILVSKGNTKEETKKKKKKARFQMENNEPATAEMDLDQSMSRVTQDSDKKHKKKKEGEEEVGKIQRMNSLITDARFTSAQLDPRFQRMPKREVKVPIDSRFSRMLSHRSFTSSAAPVDKRGKPRRGKELNPLLHYYLHEKEPEDAAMEREQGEEEIGEKEAASSDSDGGIEESSSTTDDQNDDDDGDDLSVNSDICRYLMANHEDTPTVDQETHRLAIVNMDWDHIKSVDLYVVMSSCLPKSGQILSVTIYPSEFGLKCMEVEAVRGPTSLIHDDEEQSEVEPDPEVINEKLRVYEMNKLRYYYAVAVFDSSATANHVYNTLDGTELTRTSNVFDLRFIPDSMEFQHPPRDFTTEAPTSYKEPDFQTRALQHCKVNLTWEDDEPQRVKTLRRKFNVEKLDDLNEYLASTDDSDDDHGDDVEKLRALLESNNNSDTDQNIDDKDMEITFNTGLEDLSKRILEKTDKKIETAWDRVLRRQSEKRKARQNRPTHSSSDDDSSDYDVNEAPEQPDDFFVEEPSDTNIKAGNKKDKRSKDRMKKNKKGGENSQEIEKEQEASRAELELLFAEDQDIEKGPKGYNMKSKKMKGKKKKEVAAEEKIPNVDCSNDPRFAALYTNHLYALDPTDPQYKRSVAFARKQMQKQIGSIEKDVEDDILEKQALASADEIDLVKKPVAGLKNEKHELSSIIRSLKRNIGNMKK